MKMRKLIKQIMRFGVVGASAFVIDYGLMIILTEICGINYLVSSGISFTVSVIFNYVLSVRWVFDVSGGRNKRKDFIVFVVLSVIGLGINQVMMWLLVEFLGNLYFIAKIFATAVVMVYNFITRKMFLENNGEK
jgi:putative flippase GtrA